MTVLSAQTIRRYCHADLTMAELIKDYPGTFKWTNPSPMITPFEERGVFMGKSYGLSSCGYDIRVDKVLNTAIHPDHWMDGQGCRMQNGDFLLASSIERIKMPKSLVAVVHDKSSWAREGLCVQNTVLEPGWEGYITLELSFHRPAHHVVIHRGDPIAQLMFYELDEETEQPYKGKYQNQEDRPVEAILEEEHLPKIAEVTFGR